MDFLDLMEISLMSGIKKSDKDGKMTRVIEMLTKKHGIRPIQGIEILSDIGKIVKDGETRIAFDETALKDFFRSEE